MGVMTPDEKMEDKNQFNSIFMNGECMDRKKPYLVSVGVGIS